MTSTLNYLLECVSELIALHVVLFGDMRQSLEVRLVVFFMITAKPFHKLNGLFFMAIVNKFQIHVHKHWVKDHTQLML